MYRVAVVGSFACAVAVALVLSSVLLASGAAATGRVHQRSFKSPHGGPVCTISRGKPLGTKASCLFEPPAHYATLYPDGHVEACFGTKGGAACASNPDSFRDPTLAYGRSIALGPFRCTSLRKGMRCVVARSGHGFLISRSDVSHF